MLRKIIFAFYLVFNINLNVSAQIELIPISGADIEFTIKTINGTQVFQSNGSNGNYQPYIYLRSEESVQNQTVYLELTFLDIGYGIISLENNSANQNYQNTTGKNAFLLDQKGLKTMVFELKNANFRHAQNLGADLRIYSDPSIQKHLVSAVFYKNPTNLWKEYNENFFGSYAGRKYKGADIINSNTIDGKIICGYQGWFRCPGDISNNGWVH